MPLLHCDKCQHEWETGHYNGTEKCSWCGEKSHIVRGKTNLEKWTDNFVSIGDRKTIGDYHNIKTSYLASVSQKITG